MRPLTELSPGESASIARLEGPADVRQRLLEMGVLRGQRIEVIRFAPMGDPIEVQVRGYRLSLRREDAANIIVHSG